MPPEFWQDDRLRAALASWHMGQVFYAYRVHPWHTRVVSQETLAGWLGLTQAQLSRIESATTAPQDLGKLMSWAHSLRIPGDLLWFKLPSDKPAVPAVTNDADPVPGDARKPRGRAVLPVVVNGRPVLVPVDAQALVAGGPGGLLDVSVVPADDPSTTEHEAMSPLDRRSLLKGGVAAAALPGLGLDELQHVAAALEDARRYLDMPVVDYFRRRLDGAKHDDGVQGPRKTLPVVLGLLGAIDQYAREVKPTVRRQLLSVGADGAEFAGWLYRDLHQPSTATFWYDRAMEWAQEADNPALQGYVLLKKSQMAYDEGRRAGPDPCSSGWSRALAVAAARPSRSDPTGGLGRCDGRRLPGNRTRQVGDRSGLALTGRWRRPTGLWRVFHRAHLDAAQRDQRHGGR
ncbi:helix-turn-helix domain-containing protein [Actinacidiphila epipremni]|uniref:helix-turn-helix domain-containing protein n=1 Tax=Actinacidiphila epipremni TaxID=2053013 RepID=UPI001F0EED3C|nr:helix-turn-helix domain-containing protein [Actinacidiphila epipremni]